MRLTTLKKSPEFRRVRGGTRLSTAAFLIETKRRPATDSEAKLAETPARFGFTITKKIGGAVIRNRIRRRLKSIVRTLDDDVAAAGHDYVVVARPAALTQPYGELAADFRRTLLELERRSHRASERLSGTDDGATRAPKRA